MTEVKPVLCPPFGFAEFTQYEQLAEDRVAPVLRAWVRETEKRCRANEEIYNHD